MKAVKLKTEFLVVLTLSLFMSMHVFAQDKNGKKESKKEVSQVGKNPNSKLSQKEIDRKSASVSASSGQDEKEAKKAVAYYSNYLEEYRLGPNDIISVEVFGQCPDYCKLDATVPPTARLSYPLISEGVFVGGKTAQEVADEITKKLDEYIIDPKVSVTLVKPGSAVYSVLGGVNTPGVRIMDRRV